MTSALVVVHRLSISGGRRVTLHDRGRNQILVTAYGDHYLVVFLGGAGVAEPEGLGNRSF
ncbi:hypothetical protein [Streptomyces sp. EN16]|uniref:hypothetical protein n=1 Tax=Streptomyces sp. EN16 TaxID=212773 RepID=UPI0008515B9D|nr:hypothetical protein [Streptomyces sp. EN16]